MKWSELLLPKPKFATHNLSKTFRGTLSEGLLYPIYNRIMLPGDRFKIDLRSFIRTDPTVFPVMGSYKVRIVTVVSNLKNYAIALEGYRKSFDWRSVILPHFSYVFPGGIVTSSEASDEGGDKYYPGIAKRIAVRETSLADYLGYERGWFPSVQQYYRVAESLGGYDDFVLRKTALPFLVYWDYYRNYMLNPQDSYFPCVSPYTESYDDAPKPTLTAIRSDYLDMLIEKVHAYYDGSERTFDYGKDSFHSGSVNGLATEEWPDPEYFYKLCHVGVSQSETMYDANTFSVPHGGLLGTMYDPDINTQWLSVANYERLNDVVINGTVAGQVSTTSFQDIVKASSLWQFMMGEVYSDGTYAGHIYGQYGVDVKADMNIPQIIHVMDSRIDFENITSQSDTSSQQSDGSYTGSLLGQQAGVGRGYGQSGRFEVKNTDNNLAMLMTFMWITPEVDYSTGLNPDHDIVKLSDIYVPAFDNYSMQPRLQESVNSAPIMVASGTENVVDPFDDNAVPYVGSLAGIDVLPADLALGYQPAFAEYKTDVNTVHGLFRSTMRDYTFLRRFPHVGVSRQSEGYISAYVYGAFSNGVLDVDDALTYNQPFALNRVDHFFTQVRFNITAIRPLSKSQIPNVK